MPSSMARAEFHSLARLLPSANELTALLDLTTDGMMLCRAGGALLHVNPALRAMLEADPERDVLSEAIRLLTTCMLHGRRPPEQTAASTAAATYCLKARVIRSIDSDAPAVLVAVSRVQPQIMSDEQLRRRYYLTAREIQVARLLAQGNSNADIADELQLSLHTVRHHAESVLLKLDVTNRAAVASALQR